MLTLPEEDHSAIEHHLSYRSACAATPPPVLKIRVLAAIGRVRQLAPFLAADNGAQVPGQV